MMRKESDDRYNHSEKGRATRAKYNQSLKGRKSLRRARNKYSKTEKWQAKRSRQTLNNALLRFDDLGWREGWPDAVDVEQKVGLDYIGVSQWRRAASVKTPLVLFFAKTHEDAVKGLGRWVSFEDYAKEIGSKQQWAALIAKERK
jgi:hypothetical protein